MKIYVHSETQHDPEGREVAAETRLAEAFPAEDGAPVVVLLEDGDEELDVDLTFTQAGVDDRAHLFAGRRSRVLVEVMYNGETLSHEFHASTRVQRVFEWAAGDDGFKLSRQDAAEHTLALCSSGAIPPEDTHIGSLDTETPGRLCLMLIPKHRFEG